MKNFAKLFEFDDIGQVLITCDTLEDDQPAVLLRCGNDGVTATPSWGFEDSDEGLVLRNKLFAMIDREQAYKIAHDIISALPFNGDSNG